MTTTPQTEANLALANPSATRALAARLALAARPGDTILLSGALGAGKTEFARAFIRRLTHPAEEVPSPTFTLVQTYEGSSGPIWHLDLYRLNDPSEAGELGIHEAVPHALTLIEWPERLGDSVPRPHTEIVFSIESEEARRAALTDVGGATLLARAGFGAMPVDGRKLARDAFLATSAWSDAAMAPLPGDASFRRYFRLTRNGQTMLLMDAPPPQEDTRPFIAIARLLQGLGYSAPIIHAEDTGRGFLLLEDFGDNTFTKLIAAGADEQPLYALATDLLIDLHQRFDPVAAPGLPRYDEPRLLAEAALLTDWFLPAATGEETPEPVRQAYLDSWRALLPLAQHQKPTLVLRDYHIDNLMRLDGRPGLAACGLLDFQDAVLGPPEYDLAALIEDARRDVPAELGQAMVARYLAQFPSIDPDAFRLGLRVMAAQRHAKVIGIFCRLAMRDGKPAYLGHLPRLWRLLTAACGDPALAELAAWLDAHVPAALRGIPTLADGS